MEEKYTWIERELEGELAEVLDRPEAIALLGPRQAGKTTLLFRLREHFQKQGVAVHYFTFEDPYTVEQVEKAPRRWLEQVVLPDRRNVVMLDEVHWLSGGGRILKLLYDTFPGVKFFLTGSVSLLLREIVAKMAGRVLLYRLFPFSFGEFLRARGDAFLQGWHRAFRENLRRYLVEGLWKEIEPLPPEARKQMEVLWEEFLIFGGYPGVVLAETRAVKTRLLSSILHMIFERDILALASVGKLRESWRVSRWFAANATGLLNFSELSKDIGVTLVTARRYVALLESAMVFTLLPPYYTNPATELKKQPRIFFFDSGLRNAFLMNFAGLAQRTDQGPLTELFVFSELVKSLPPWYELRYWRTKRKQEVDFVVVGNGEAIPVEVKAAPLKEPKLSPPFRAFLRQYHPRRAVVVNRTLLTLQKWDKTQVLFCPVFGV